MVFRAVFLSCLLLGIAAPGAALAQERQWSFDQTEADAYLVFGVPETDDVGLSLWCTKGSGTVSLFVPDTGKKLKRNQTIKIGLMVGNKRFRYAAKSADNKLLETTSAEIALKTGDPLFAALSKGDRITVKIGTAENIYPLSEVDFDTFLQLCAKH